MHFFLTEIIVVPEPVIMELSDTYMYHQALMNP